MSAEDAVGRPAVPVSRREPGGLRDRVRVADDFDAPLPPEVAAAFTADQPGPVDLPTE